MKVYKTIVTFFVVVLIGMGMFSVKAEAVSVNDKEISTAETLSGESTASGATSEETASDKAADNQNLEGSTKLYIDNKNIYKGMDKSYSEGYVPSVKKGYVYLVLPLQCEKELKKDTIRTTVHLGDGDTIPFVRKNYEKNFKKEKCKVSNKSKKTECYLVSYALQLKEDRYNGSYPVTVNVSAIDNNGDEIEQVFTTYVTITDGKNLTEEPVAETPVFAPKVLVESYHFSKEDIKAGDEVTAEIVLVNTSKSQAVRNMTVMVTPAEGIELVSKSDSVYVESAGAGEIFTVTYDFKVDVAANAGQYSVSIAMDYADYEGNAYTSTGTIKLSVGQLVKMQFDPLVVPSEVEVGETIEATTQVMNLGRGKIYNVRAEIVADGVQTSQTMFIGDVEAGAAVSGSTELFIVGLSGASLYGNTEGTVTFYYEDEGGEEYSEVITFKTTIVSPLKASQNVEEEDNTDQWWVIMAVIGCILAVIVVTLAARKVNSRRAETRNEDN